MEFLEALRGERYCCACLSRLLQAPKSTVHEATIAIDGVRGFARRYRSCAACGKIRIVVYAERAEEEN